MTAKATSTTRPEKMKAAAAAKLLYKSATLAILADLRNPFILSQDHPDWRYSFVSTIKNPRVHQKLTEKLARFGPIVIYYSRIKPVYEDVLAAARFPEATVFVISSVGEHNMTSWMIIHNIGHTMISRHGKIKKEVIELLGQKTDHFGIKMLQRKLVTCASSKKHMIPNVNELIYELFTTWVWYGATKSPHRKLAKYCDAKFKSLMEEHRNKMTYHRYRAPVEAQDLPWLNDLFQ